MRPINKGSSHKNYKFYEDAKPDLVNQLGSYCSYCERRICTNLAVEHIQPKSLPQYKHLENEWSNFLLSCVNCNSSKSDKPVELDSFVFPDRDNTFIIYSYNENGWVNIMPNLPQNIREFAVATRDLVALNSLIHPNWNEAVLFSAIERIGQRVQAWVQAKDARKDYEVGETSAKRIAIEAAATGFFSIWMAAFEGIPEVRRKIIQAYPNTATDCFDDITNPQSPRPTNGLVHGGKI